MIETVVVRLNILTNETSGTEEEAAEVLLEELQVDIEEEGEVDGEGKEEGYRNQGALGALDFFT